MKDLANNVKEDISHELQLHELHENLKKAEQQGLSDLSPELKESIDKLNRAAESVRRPYSSIKNSQRPPVKQDETKDE